MAEKFAHSLALDLLFNGQDMDYCEQPLNVSSFKSMDMLSGLKDSSTIGVVGPGGGRLVKSLTGKGYEVEAFEGRHECADHLQKCFRENPAVKILPMAVLDDKKYRDKLRYEALICLDDLRAFRGNDGWAENVQQIISPDGYFVYSQVFSKIGPDEEALAEHFDLVGNYDVSEIALISYWKAI